MTEKKSEPDSSKRLQQVLSGVSTSEMKAVRAGVQEELRSLPATPIPSLRVGMVPPPPAPVVVDSSKKGLSNSDIEDLQRAGKIASDFLTGMDKITDVLMLLVLKFGRASTLMRAVFWGIIVGVLLLAANLFILWNISVSQTALQEQQARILEKQLATQLAAGEAKEKAEAAAQKASEIQQKAPAVVIDSKGKPQLILQVQNPAEGETPTKTLEPPAKSKIRGNDGEGQTLEVPLKF